MGGSEISHNGLGYVQLPIVELSNIALNLMGQLHIACVMPRFYSNFMNHQFKQNKADEYYTKEYAIKPLLKYIPTDKTVWCPFDKKESNFVKLLQEQGNNVIFSHIETGQDFFEYEPQNYDYIVSNPPYSLRELILERLFFLGKPFAMLINEAGLFDSKKRYELLKNNRFEIMVFDKRIDYIKGEEMLKGVPFKSIFFCSNILPKQFTFEVLS